MMLFDKTMKEFVEQTASSSPTPGGGSVAAFEAASAAALISMVANLTIGKSGYEEVQEEMKKVIDKTEEYRTKFLELMHKDASSFDEAMKAFRLPKNTEEEKRYRSQKIQEGYQHATVVPFEVGKTVYELFDLAELVIEKGNQNAVTDGLIAVLQSRTALHSAFYNVKINLSEIKDSDFVESMRKEMATLEQQANRREEEIRAKVSFLY